MLNCSTAIVRPCKLFSLSLGYPHLRPLPLSLRCNVKAPGRHFDTLLLLNTVYMYCVSTRGMGPAQESSPESRVHNPDSSPGNIHCARPLACVRVRACVCVCVCVCVDKHTLGNVQVPPSEYPFCPIASSVPVPGWCGTCTSLFFIHTS